MVANTHVQRPSEEDVILGGEHMQRYQYGAGSLLYVMKPSRLDLCNYVRELTNVMDGAMAGHEKQLFHILKFVSEMKFWGLSKLTKSNWKIMSYMDSDWAGDADYRKSVSGWAILI